ncbi:hypothetical protein P8605_02775 [Streptomyces sp. T-3]|nr:hypothetical protein [Streptomyces sp. T-3]
MRRALRREISGTIGLLADEDDFRAMRHYRSFAFGNYAAYLTGVEDLLRTRAAKGTHTLLALFDPQEFADFCSGSGLDPDSPSSRARFTADLATTGTTTLYDGEPLADLIPVLVDEAVRRSTWEYASSLLASLGTCGCGKDHGREAFSRAASLLVRILEAADPGERHLVCSVSAAPETLVASLHTDTGIDGAVQLDEGEALEFTTILALGLAALPGGLIMRASSPSATDRVYGWRLRAGDLEPLTAAEVFDAYRTDFESGEPVPAEPGLDYCDPPDLGPHRPTPGHRR